jgi:hypothetical protein
MNRHEPPGDLIGRYLDELRRGLRAVPGEADAILAEAEDHLRETAAAGIAVGMTQRDAQEAAISSFGPVRAVTRAHLAQLTRRPAILAILAMAASKLVSLLLLAGGLSGIRPTGRGALSRTSRSRSSAGTRRSCWPWRARSCSSATA